MERTSSDILREHVKKMNPNYIDPAKELHALVLHAAQQAESAERQVETLNRMLLEMQDKVIIAKEEAAAAKAAAKVACRRFWISTSIAILALIVSLLK